MRPAPDRDLATYRAKRRVGATPEPIPPRRSRPRARSEQSPTFVVQEHHASSLHWDFRLEHDGVLVSWALPKGLPTDPGRNHLAVPTEDHPLEYATFAGTIPAGEYGGGQVSIWDHGTYECEKWTDREVKVVLHGGRVDGRYVLFPTRPGQWMIHRMDAPADAGLTPAESVAPMLATAGPLAEGGPDDWAYEFKWDGIRAVRAGRRRTADRHQPQRARPHRLGARTPCAGRGLRLPTGRARRRARRPGRRRRPVLRPGPAPGEGRRGPPAAVRTRDPVSYVVFDLLHLDGHDLLGDSYDDRRRLLESALPTGPSWGATPSFTGQRRPRRAGRGDRDGHGGRGRQAPVERLPSGKAQSRLGEDQAGAHPGGGGGRMDRGRRRTPGNLRRTRPRHPPWRWRPPSARASWARSGPASTPPPGTALLREMHPLERATPPFDPAPPTSVARQTTWVRPTLVGEVRFREWTGDDRLRHPVWRGRRDDKDPGEVPS